MAENNQDAKQTSKKDAKRDAKIEAKRRRLAEQRAGRLRADAEPAAADSPTFREWYDAEKQAKQPLGSEKQAADREITPPIGAAKRPVSSDSANREWRPVIPETAAPGETGAPAAHRAGAEEAGSRKASRKDRKAGKKRGTGGGGFRVTPGFILRCIIALAALILIIYIVLRVANYNDSKPDFMVTDEGFYHAERFDGAVPVFGIDVSEHQKGDINWKKVKSCGIDFVFIRAGYRAADDGTLHEDKNFRDNLKKANKAGLMTGAYFYSQALTPGEAKEEAEFVLDMVKGKDISMPIAIDYEIYKDGRLDKKIQAGDLYAASLYHDIVLGFTSTVEDAGYESAVYASRDMLTNYMQADLLDDMATIWLARYDSDAGLDANYMFWQCTENGKVSGIDGEVDRDFWYIQPEKVYETRAKHKKKAVSVRDCRISFNESKTEIHSFRAMPSYDITYEENGLKEGRDYIASVIRNTQAGTGYVIIRGINNYKDWIMYPFTVEE